MRIFRILQLADELKGSPHRLLREVHQYLEVSYDLAMQVLQSDFYKRSEIKELVDNILCFANERKGDANGDRK